MGQVSMPSRASPAQFYGCRACQGARLGGCIGLFLRTASEIAGGSGRTFSDGISDGPPRRFARTPRAPRAWVPYISPSRLYPFSGMPLVMMLSTGMLSLMYELVAYGMLTWGYGYGIVLM